MTTIQLILILAIVFSWTTVQVDNTNSFAQATMAGKLHMELPYAFTPPEPNKDYVLKIHKTLYGLCQALFSRFEHLKLHLGQ